MINLNLRRNRKLFFLFFLCLISFFIRLYILEEEDFKVNKMSAIVFLKKIYYYDYKDRQLEAENSFDQMLVFYDNKGNYYTSKDSYVCSLSIEELVKEYEEGNLNHKIKLFSSCNVYDLKLNYEKLIKVIKNKNLKIVYPEYQKDEVLSSEKIKEFYGIYNTSEGIKHLKLHRKDGFGDYYTNDDLANEIYDWYKETFKKDK